MRTLFGENILSPPPKVSPLSTPNPVELSFPSSQSRLAAKGSHASSSQTSTQSSPRQNQWLTNYLQYQQGVGQVGHQTTNDASSHYDHVRRKGNPNLLFMGMRKSGKSSIQKVIFEKFSPAETLYLDPTNKIETATMESFMTFESSELPATTTATLHDPSLDPSPIFSSAGSIIWILDMQDEYFHSISQFITTAVYAFQHHPRLHLEIFIHKTDGLSEEYKYDTYRDVRQRVQDELADAGYPDRAVSFYQTSIFDHSVYEALSKVIQKLLPQLPAMEALLNKLCTTCRIQKAYLFDTISKIYLATDASPTFLRDYEVCSDYVDVIVDIKQIYGWQTRGQDGVLLGSSTKQKNATATAAEESGAVGESLITYDKTGNTYIYAREINDYLSLICVMGQGSTADKRVLIDYNVSILHDALVQVFKL